MISPVERHPKKLRKSSETSGEWRVGSIPVNKVEKLESIRARERIEPEVVSNDARLRLTRMLRERVRNAPFRKRLSHMKAAGKHDHPAPSRTPQS
jgi:hypothetical protein